MTNGNRAKLAERVDPIHPPLLQHLEAQIKCAARIEGTRPKSSLSLRPNQNPRWALTNAFGNSTMQTWFFMCKISKARGVILVDPDLPLV
ncbi:hypothetical protein VNO77_02945 [Canavalia gladiata]|uniref:Uncharacterized protein n=1 Tax=Canavalia gladiata TaxID=3824 RepID=A0AAN9MUJ2_CANGL